MKGVDFEISCVEMFVFDPMHLVYLGAIEGLHLSGLKIP